MTKLALYFLRMLRLSNIVLEEICGYMHMRAPSRRCGHPKAKFMMEMADKVAVWIDEVLAESDDRMLMMDYDEDEEVEQSAAEADRPVAPSGSQTNAAATPAESMTPADSATATPGATTASATPDAQTPAQTPGQTPAPTPGQTPASSKTNLAPK